jgi:hypothetical protein
MILDGRPRPRFEEAWMDRHQLVLMVDAQGIRRDLQPQCLVDQAKRRRVVAVRMLDVAVAVQLGLGPGRARRRDGG